MGDENTNGGSKTKGGIQEGVQLDMQPQAVRTQACCTSTRRCPRRHRKPGPEITNHPPSRRPRALRRADRHLVSGPVFFGRPKFASISYPQKTYWGPFWPPGMDPSATKSTKTVIASGRPLGALLTVFPKMCVLTVFRSRFRSFVICAIALPSLCQVFASAISHGDMCL
jgi:hypothetical protein